MIDPIGIIILLAVMTISFFFIWLFDKKTVTVDGKTQEVRKEFWLISWIVFLCIFIFVTSVHIYREHLVEFCSTKSDKQNCYDNLLGSINFNDSYNSYKTKENIKTIRELIAILKNA